MTQNDKYVFNYQEVVEALIKKQGIKTGLWALGVEFGLRATNLGPNDQDLKPAIIIPIMNIQLTRANTPSNLTVDASTLSQKSRSTIVKKKSATKKLVAKKVAKKKK